MEPVAKVAEGEGNAKRPVVSITRIEAFNAAHRLYWYDVLLTCANSPLAANHSALKRTTKSLAKMSTATATTTLVLP